LAELLPASAFLFREVVRVEELAGRRRAHDADDAGLKIKEHRAGHVFSARGHVVKNVDAAELRVVVAEVLCRARRTPPAKI